MAVTETWDATKPADSRDPKLGDDDIREFKRTMREIARNGGHVFPTSDPTSAAATWGRHSCGEEFDFGGAGSPLAGEFYIYAADKTTKIATFADSTAADPSVADFTGLTVRGTNVDSGNNPGHGHDHTVSIPLPASATGRVNGVMLHNSGNGTLTILSAQLFCFTAPSGDVVDVDINIVDLDGADDPDDAGTSIFAANPHPTVADGNKKGTAVSTFDDDALPVGDAWVFDVDTLTSPADDLVLVLKVRRA